MEVISNTFFLFDNILKSVDQNTGFPCLIVNDNLYGIYLKSCILSILYILSGKN